MKRGIALLLTALPVVVACNSDKKEADEDLKQAASLLDSTNPADLDKADQLIGDALKKDPSNPGIPPVVDRLKARRAGTAKANPATASLGDCQAACSNDEDTRCKKEPCESCSADTKADIQKECDAHTTRDSCIGICTKVWLPADAACVKASASRADLDKCLPSKLRRMPPTKEWCQAKNAGKADLLSMCMDTVAWGQKILTPDGFQAERSK